MGAQPEAGDARLLADSDHEARLLAVHQPRFVAAVARVLWLGRPGLLGRLLRLRPPVAGETLRLGDLGRSHPVLPQGPGF